MTTKAERAESLEQLRGYLKRGDTVTCVLRHRNRNGTSWIDFYRFGCSKKGRADRLWLSYHIARALGLPFDGRRECVRIGYLNMDPGFEVVYRLAIRLFGHNKRRRPGGHYGLQHDWL